MREFACHICVHDPRDDTLTQPASRDFQSLVNAAWLNKYMPEIMRVDILPDANDDPPGPVGGSVYQKSNARYSPCCGLRCNFVYHVG